MIVIMDDGKIYDSACPPVVGTLVKAAILFPEDFADGGEAFDMCIRHRLSGTTDELLRRSVHDALRKFLPQSPLQNAPPLRPQT